MKQSGSVSAFGQADPTDGRERYDWKSKYGDPDARKEIRREAIYLGSLLFILPVLMLVLWLDCPIISIFSIFLTKNIEVF
jgi:hypothetical protein